MDATRSINMIKTMRVDVLGVVENFSGDIFGAGAGEELAQELDLAFLGRTEMRADYRDVSRPTVLTSKDSARRISPHRPFDGRGAQQPRGLERSPIG